MQDHRLVTFNIEGMRLGERRIQVFLPSDYHQSDAHYPVLYMHDGQMLFDATVGINRSGG